jgi:hypothetical protein
VPPLTALIASELPENVSPDALIKVAVQTTEFCAVGTPDIEKCPSPLVLPDTPWQETLAPEMADPDWSTTDPMTVVKGSIDVNIVIGGEFATFPTMSTAVALKTTLTAVRGTV